MSDSSPDSSSIVITTDVDRMDIDAIHEFLSNESYWAAGIPMTTLRRAMEHSLCFGVLEDTQQVDVYRRVAETEGESG